MDMVVSRIATTSAAMSAQVMTQNFVTLPCWDGTDMRNPFVQITPQQALRPLRPLHRGEILSADWHCVLCTIINYRIDYNRHSQESHGRSGSGSISAVTSKRLVASRNIFPHSGRSTVTGTRAR